jgi:hypothetical protein
MRLVRKGLLKAPVTLWMRRKGYLLSYVQAVASGQAGN